MAKTILGVDIGYDNMKLALVRGREVLETVSVPMPKNMVRDGHIVSDETMGELIRTTMRENGMRTNAAAFVIPDETVFVKNVVMPAMTEEQLDYNLPFEFRDYITGEIREYVFDYAMLSDPPAGRGPAQWKKAGKAASGEPSDEKSEEAPKMELLAVSVPKAYMEETRGMLRKAGMKLEKAAPSICSYINLIRLQQEKKGSSEEEYCILDLGYQAIRMHMYKGDRYVFTRVLDIGLSMLDEVLADAFSVDIHLAHMYLMTNYEGCQERAECETAYSSIAMELMRVLNFYRYSNPDSNITNMWLCGGGAVIKALRETIADSLDLNVYPASDLVPGGDEIGECNSFVQAIGMAIQ